MELIRETRDKIYVATYHQVHSRLWHIWDLLIKHYLDNMEHCAYSQANDYIYDKCAFTQNMSLIAERGAKKNFDIIKEKNAIT